MKKWINKLLLKWGLKQVTKQIDSMKKSSKTTITGWLQLAIGVLTAAVSLLVGEGIGDLEPITTALLAVGVTIPGWLQGIFARDHNVSSNSAGVE